MAKNQSYKGLLKYLILLIALGCYQQKAIVLDKSAPSATSVPADTFSSIESDTNYTFFAYDTASEVEVEIAELSNNQKLDSASSLLETAIELKEEGDLMVAEFYCQKSKYFLQYIDLNDSTVNLTQYLDLLQQINSFYQDFVSGVEELPEDAPSDAVITGIEMAEGDTFTTEEEFPEKQEVIFDSTSLDSILAIKREYPAVPYSEHEKVLRAIRFFQGKGRKVFARWLERAEYNIPIMKNILREEGVPEELVYLSMIESGFNPKAYSYAHASGPWQFIRSTGKIFGLKVDFWYDERRDIVKSTKAAARYLKRLYLEFDDWYLAMAAYNCGERKVLSHTRKYKTKDFWKLRRLPAQTRNYVPTYLAARAIAENPNEFGFDDIVLKNLAPYDSVLIRECTDLATIAQLVDTTLEYIRELNPAIMRWCTPPSIDSIWIYVPWGKSDEFLAGIEQVPDSAKMSWVRHYIKSGETLKQIAGKYGVTTQAIKDIKSNDIRGNRVIAGEVLLIPIPSQKYQKAWAEQEKKDSHLYPEEGRRTVYTVRKGDTLSGIAKKFGIPLSKLRISNGLGKRNLIRPGQKLIIYDSKKIYTPKTVYQSANPIESKNIPRFHRVKQGESLWTIANKYGLSLKELKEMNNLGSESIIKPGEELVLSHRSAKSQSSDGDSIIYTVKKGDTLWSIASEFGVRISDLKEENGLHGSTVIKVGDKLRIPK